jgi:alkylated DNA nucleotide flippase Atl1
LRWRAQYSPADAAQNRPSVVGLGFMEPIPPAQEFLRVARLVQKGEWTTYGDISGAVLGHKRAARIVGALAATDDLFPNAHRVLTSEGRVSRPGRDPKPAARALESEGVAFVRGRADPTRRIHWDELQRRGGRVARDSR